jgi:hypothetical protein
LHPPYKAIAPILLRGNSRKMIDSLTYS